MKNKDILIKVIAEFCRLLIGGVFIFSGFVKAIDPVGNAIKIHDYLTAFGMEVFLPLKTVIAFNLSAIELLLGVTMLLGVYRKYTSILVLIFMIVMTPLTLYLAIFDPVSDCGCFGEALVITNWQTFYKNIILLAAAVFVFIFHKRLFQVFTYKVYWFVAVWTYVYCIAFSYWNYNHLPLLDFRPYKIGANIPELMHIPEDAPQDEYRFVFIYEKDGVKQEFGLDDYPADDTTWTFIDTKTELIKEGYHPAVSDFHIYNDEGDDISGEILANQEGILLLIAPKLEEASDERIDEINDVYDYSIEKNITFYCVTGSPEEAIEQWIDRSGAEYPFLFADDILLKTIIRSNPGLVLLKEGTVFMKWHYKDIPEEDEIDSVITTLLQRNEPEKESNGWIVFNLLTFTIPLLLVWMYDFFRFRRRPEELSTTEE